MNEITTNTNAAHAAALAMRNAAAALARRRPLYDGASGESADEDLAQAIEDLGKERGSPPFRQSRDGGDSWIVIDFVDVVVHLFEPEQRAFYDLDGLWSDAPQVPWRAAAR